MAIGTITINSEVQLGKVKLLNISFAGDGSYHTGGTHDFAVTLNTAIKTKALLQTDKNIRAAENITVDAVVGAGGCGQYIPLYLPTTDQLYVRDGGSASLAQVAGAANLGGTTFNVVVIAH
jgi:hypothetical protein